MTINRKDNGFTISVTLTRDELKQAYDEYNKYLAYNAIACAVTRHKDDEGWGPDQMHVFAQRLGPMADELVKAIMAPSEEAALMVVKNNVA